MKIYFLIVLLFSLVNPISIHAEDGEMESMPSEFPAPQVEEMAPPSYSTPTESPSENFPSSMEEATFDDVSFE